MAYVPRHRRPNAVAQQNSPTAREAREARADKHAELRPLTPRQPVTNSKAETGMRTGTGTGTETGTETVQEPETQLETPQLRWMQLCSHPELTAASELASVTCDKLVDAGKLRTRPPYVRQDREDLLAGVFAECGLDGGKMCSLGRTQAVWDLEPLIRGATRGETWVDDVLKELNSLLSEVFCWAAACDGQQEMQEAEDMIADSDTLSVSDNSSASTHHSISTSAIPIKQTLHAQERMYERNVDLLDCQRAIKHGQVYETFAPSAMNRHNVRYGISHPDKPLVLITDESLMTGITVIRFDSAQMRDEYVNDRLGAKVPTEEQHCAIRVAIEDAFDRRDEAERNTVGSSGLHLLPAATVQVPRCAIMHVIGRNWATIVQLQRDTKTFARIRQHNDKLLPTPVDLFGADSAVAEAKTKIDEIIERELAKEIARQKLPPDWRTRPDYEYRELQVPGHALGHVIGKDGSRLKLFRSKGAEIHLMVQTHTDHGTMYVRGLPHAVAAAAGEIDRTIALSGQKDRAQVRALGARLVRSEPQREPSPPLQPEPEPEPQLRANAAGSAWDSSDEEGEDATGARKLHIPTDPFAVFHQWQSRSASTDKSCDRPEQREETKSSQQLQVGKTAKKTREVRLPVYSVKHVIGSGGSKVKQLQTQCAKIKIEKREDGSAIAHVSGSPEEIDDVVACIESIIAKARTCTSTAPPKKKKTVQKPDPGGANDERADRAELAQQSMVGVGDRAGRRQKEKWGDDRPEEIK